MLNDIENKKQAPALAIIMPPSTQLALTLWKQIDTIRLEIDKPK